jgi:hypothetical protein
VLWDLQETIEELGLKIGQAANGAGGGGGTADSSGLEEIWKQLAIQGNQRNLLRGIEERVLGAPGPLPMFHSGGTMPGPRTREGVALLRGEERIRTPEQEIQMAEAIRDVGRGDGRDAAEVPIIQVIVEKGAGVDPDKIRTITSHDKRREARGAGRGLARAGEFAR